MLVVAFPDPVIETRGHQPGSPYIEQVWLPRLGPASTWLWTRLARTAAAKTSTVVDMADLAAGLGLGPQLGPNATISRTIGRAVWFDTLRRAGNTLAVRTALPDLPARQIARPPAPARLAHQHLAKSLPTPLTPQAEHPHINEGVAL